MNDEIASDFWAPKAQEDVHGMLDMPLSEGQVR